jgi:hypothetical protein
MPRIFYIHWNMAEALVRVHELRQWGYEVNFEASDGARACRTIVENGAEAVVINLDRLPSHGRITAEHLRKLGATREIPIIFVDGEPENVEIVRERVSDAIFVKAARLQQVLLGLFAVSPISKVETAELTTAMLKRRSTPPHLRV